mmetsp:Transcript_68475/g.160620  ORF Transcript_68475/g.160620 Transcript_68475/m.160620 type:complete len:171 (-) Transcript_68475:58-570(-)
MPTNGFLPHKWNSLNDPIPFFDYWRIYTPFRKDIDSEYFPNVNTMRWPYGTKGSYISPEAALRFGNILGLNIFGTEGRIRKYAKKRNAGIIGEGLVAFPPCSPQPYCVILEVLKKKIAGVPEEDCMVSPDVVALVLPAGEQACPRRWKGRAYQAGERSRSQGRDFLSAAL